MKEINSGFKSIFSGLFQIWKGSRKTVVALGKMLASCAPGISVVMMGNYFGYNVPNLVIDLANSLIEAVL